MEHPAGSLRPWTLGALALFAAAPAWAQQAGGGAELETLRQRLDAQQRQIQALESRLREAGPVLTTPAPEEAPGVRSGARVVSGEFPGSFVVPGSELSVKIGGYVKADAIIDFDPIGNEQLFVTNAIPTDGEDPNFDTRTHFHARQTRINVDARKADTPYGPFQAFVEVDFFGSGGNEIVTNSYGLRMRHAYGILGPVLAGQTWTTFMDPAALPQLLDFEGPNGQTFVRQAQLRYTREFAAGASVALALENPESDVLNAAGERINRDELPDAVLRLRWERDWGHLQAGGLFRQISVSSPVIDDQEFGWGANLSGKIKVPLGAKDNAFFQLNGGDGIGRYIFDIAGSSADAVVVPAGDSIQTLTAWGGFLGYQHWWSGELRSSLVYSRVEVDVEDYQPDSALETTQYAAANLIWSPISQTNFGAEYLWGRREDKDGASGDANRLQFSAQYLF